MLSLSVCVSAVVVAIAAFAAAIGTAAAAAADWHCDLLLLALLPLAGCAVIVILLCSFGAATLDKIACQ